MVAVRKYCSVRVALVRSRLAELDDDVHRLAVADDGDADGLAGPVFLDFGQELFDGAHALVLDGDDQVGGVGVERPADDSRGRAVRPCTRTGWMPACSAGPPSTIAITSSPSPVA